MLNQLCSTQKGRAALVFSVIAAVAAISLLYSQVQQREETHHLARLQQVVQAIQAGALKPDKEGDIVLPPRFSGLTKNGRVYLCTDPKQPFLLFPEQIDTLEIEWQSGLPPNRRLPTQHKLQISGYAYAQVSLPNGGAVNVDDPAVEPVFAEMPPKKSNWYYAEPMPD